MKKALAIAGALALAVTPAASFACDLSGFDLRRANLMGADVSGANLSVTNLNGITATNLRGCPSSLPNGWVCKNNSLIQC